MATVAGATTSGLIELEMLLLVIMIGTFASTAVAVGQRVTLHIVVAAGGVEGSTDTASGPIASRCHNVQLPDRSRRLLVVNRANAADDRRRYLERDGEVKNVINPDRYSYMNKTEMLICLSIFNKIQIIQYFFILFNVQAQPAQTKV